MLAPVRAVCVQSPSDGVGALFEFLSKPEAGTPDVVSACHALAGVARLAEAEIIPPGQVWTIAAPVVFLSVYVKIAKLPKSERRGEGA